MKLQISARLVIATWGIGVTALTEQVPFTPPASVGAQNPSNRTLLPLNFSPHPLGRIHATPGSWLDNELHNSAAGLAGHLLDFYAYARNSSWLGGDAEYSPLNEGFPYAFNGLVALAYTLPDGDSEAVRLRTLVNEVANYVLDRQRDDGWLGPEEGSRRLLWGRFPFLLGLTQLVDADDQDWDCKVVPALRRFVILMQRMLMDGGKGFVHQGDGDPISQGDYSWGRVRVADLIMVLQWSLEKYPGQQEDVIWDCMRMLYDFSLKWEDWYNEAAYIKEDLYRVPVAFTEAHYAYEHGVNVGQGLKAPAVIRRFTHNDSLLQTAADAVDWTFRFHGAASGTILGDERIDGLSPYSGSELCTTVETMFSLSYLYQSLGINKYADIAELAAFNALPTMLTADHWAHQYMSQPNQPFSKILSESPFFNANSYAQTYGLEPHYPCCTVNLPQGLPKFLSATWVQVGKTGLAHVLLSPSSVRTEHVNIECETEYPFGDSLEYLIDSDESFDFYIRIPGWAARRTSKVRVGIAAATMANPDPRSGLYKILLPSGHSRVTLELSPLIRTTPRANDTVAVYRGSLLYALEIGSWTSASRPKAYHDHSEYPPTYAPPASRDWSMTNASAWNVAIDPSTLSFHRDVPERLPKQIFAPGAPPVFMTARGCQIEWPLFLGSVPGAIPPKDARKCLGGPFEITLRPYGSTKLHMAELPTINLSTSHEQKLR